MAKTMIKTKAKKPKKAKRLTWEEMQKQNLTIQQELFCQYYVKTVETRGNGLQSYNLAYDKRLEEQSKDDAVYDIDKETGKRTIVETSTYFKVENICKSEASNLLAKPNVSKRVTELLNEMLTDEIVDGELAKVVLQDGQLKPKVSAIQEYNKLRQRIVDRQTVEHTFALEEATDEEIEAILKEESKVFNKK